jgi:hypothetical protein
MIFLLLLIAGEMLNSAEHLAEKAMSVTEYASMA